MGSSVLLHSKVPQGPSRCQCIDLQHLRVARVPTQCSVLCGPDRAGWQCHPEADLWQGGRLPLPLLAHLHSDWRKHYHRHGETHPVSVHRERAAQTHQDVRKLEGFKVWRMIPGGHGVRGQIRRGDRVSSMRLRAAILGETKIVFVFLAFFLGWFQKKIIIVTILERFSSCFFFFWLVTFAASKL